MICILFTSKGATCGKLSVGIIVRSCIFRDGIECKCTSVGTDGDGLYGADGSCGASDGGGDGDSSDGLCGASDGDGGGDSSDGLAGDGGGDSSDGLCGAGGDGDGDGDGGGGDSSDGLCGAGGDGDGGDGGDGLCDDVDGGLGITTIGSSSINSSINTSLNI